MLTDYEILGLPEKADLATVRRAYRKRVKEIHPDVTTEADLLKNHLLFIRINKAYERLLAAHGSSDFPAPAADSAAVSAGGFHPADTGVTAYKDPAYAFYKAGMTQFMKIHPSQWSMETRRVLDKPGPPRIEELEKIQEKVRNLVRLFPKAYYYFSLVVHEYPESVWTHDAREKMTRIEEQTLRYRKIIESFTEHAREVPRVNRMFRRGGS